MRTLTVPVIGLDDSGELCGGKRLQRVSGTDVTEGDVGGGGRLRFFVLHGEFDG